MTDDDMEISSEHGHNAGDEDIDIDIDLTTGQLDEDYMLEDAQSNNAMEDSIQASPTMNDDLMLDDENVSYTMDDDILQAPEDHTMEHETPTMSFTEIERDDTVVLDDPSEALHVVDEDSMQEADALWDTAIVTGTAISQDAVLEPVETGYAVVEGVIPTSEHVADVLDGSSGQQNQPQDLEVSNEDVGEQSPRDALNEQESVGGRHKSISRSKSPPTLNNQPNSNPEVQISVGNTENIPVGEAKESPEQWEEESTKPTEQLSNHGATSTDAQSNEQQSPSHAETAELTPAQKVIVVYNSIEYKLFSAPEDDDPDSFFLSDISISGKPVGDLFSAIREIIYEELSIGDELIMTIEELGIDIEETSSSISAVTFQQLLDAREKMLQNQGSESSEPLFVILGKRRSLETKIAMMTSWGEEGKDLSEIRWDEESEDNGDASEFADGEYDNTSHLSNVESGDEAQGEEINLSEEVAENHDPESPEQLNGSGPNTPNSHHLETERKSIAEAIVSNGSAIQEAATVPPLPEAESANLEDDDGDLIDYEDEEVENVEQLSTVQAGELNGTAPDFLLPCIKPVYCLCLNCNETLMQGYEIINEELRRRLNLRTAKEDLLWDNQAKNNANTCQVIDTDPNPPNSDDNHEAKEDEYQESRDHEHSSGEQVAEGTAVTADDDGSNLSGTGHDEHDLDEADRYEAEHEEDIYEYHDDEVGNDDHIGATVDKELDASESLADVQGTTVLPSSNPGDHTENGENHAITATELLAETDQDGGNQDYLDLEADIGNPDASVPKEARSEASSNGVTETADSESVTIASANTLDVDEINYDELDESTAEKTETAILPIPSNDDGPVETLETISRDEIDYDDDEEEHSLIPNITPVKQTAVPSGSTSTKRPRAEAGLEDAMDASTKEAKRVRS